MMIRKFATGYLAALVLLAACATPPDYAAVVASTDRLAADRKADDARKPADVLAFTGAKPGMTVLDMEAGGGYFTELLARAVGPTGKVIMQQPKEFVSFYQKDIDARLGANRLPNVTQSYSMFDRMEPASGSVDIVTWFQGPHELWCKKACSNAEGQALPMGEPATVFAEISRVLKPGGTLVIIDHVALQARPPRPAMTSTASIPHRSSRPPPARSSGWRKKATSCAILPTTTPRACSTPRFAERPIRSCCASGSRRLSLCGKPKGRAGHSGPRLSRLERPLQIPDHFRGGNL